MDLVFEMGIVLKHNHRDGRSTFLSRLPGAHYEQNWIAPTVGYIHSPEPLTFDMFSVDTQRGREKLIVGVRDELTRGAKGTDKRVRAAGCSRCAPGNGNWHKHDDSG